MCESCASFGHSEESHGGIRVPAERSLHQPGPGNTHTLLDTRMFTGHKNIMIESNLSMVTGDAVECRLSLIDL